MLIAGAALLGAASVIKRKKKEKQKYDSDRKDLFGTHLCNYGKRDENGWRIDCNISCPVFNRCTQRGRYK